MVGGSPATRHPGRGGPSRGTTDELSLYDVCPTALALLEQAVPEGLDGRVASGVIDPAWLRNHPVKTSGGHGGRAEVGQHSDEAGEYSDEDAAAVAAHLKDLGYIE